METSCKGGAEEKRTAAENGVIQRSRIKTVSEISCNFKTSPRRLTFLSSLKPPAEAVDLPSISPTKSAINCMKILKAITSGAYEQASPDVLRINNK